jgi:GntR family negative regulator for fad regulon and positive regulator of fabA
VKRWSAPQRPAAYAEEAVITAILDGSYAPGSTLPGERDLAKQLGVTRPTLREALQRLACEGWLTIQQGKFTRVNHFWQDGGLNVLSAIVRYGKQLPSDFVPNLLDVRLVLAPAYTRAAVENSPKMVLEQLAGHVDLEDNPQAFATFDWALHHTLAVASGNPIYTLILNGFSSFYQEMAYLYFERDKARAASRRFYQNLTVATQRGDPVEAEHITRGVMQESIVLWHEASQQVRFLGGDS